MGISTTPDWWNQAAATKNTAIRLSLHFDSKDQEHVREVLIALDGALSEFWDSVTFESESFFDLHAIRDGVKIAVPDEY